MQHSSGFLKIVDDAKSRITEVSLEQARARLAGNPRAVLLDVREDREWTAGHAVEARHLGKGILERDLETMIPDPETEIIMYCGGGFRSALTCDVAQRMGYGNVKSLAAGCKPMVASGWPMTAIAAASALPAGIPAHHLSKQGDVRVDVAGAAVRLGWLREVAAVGVVERGRHGAGVVGVVVVRCRSRPFLWDSCPVQVPFDGAGVLGQSRVAAGQRHVQHFVGIGTAAQELPHVELAAELPA